MLDFIVLGIVPGTDFVITLWWALFFALIVSLLALIYVEINKPRNQRIHGELEALTDFDLSVDLKDVAIAGQ